MFIWFLSLDNLSVLWIIIYEPPRSLQQYLIKSFFIMAPRDHHISECDSNIWSILDCLCIGSRTCLQFMGPSLSTILSLSCSALFHFIVFDAWGVLQATQDRKNLTTLMGRYRVNVFLLRKAFYGTQWCLQWFFGISIRFGWFIFIILPVNGCILFSPFWIIQASLK